MNDYTLTLEIKAYMALLGHEKGYITARGSL